MEENVHGAFEGGYLLHAHFELIAQQCLAVVEILDLELLDPISAVIALIDKPLKQLVDLLLVAHVYQLLLELKDVIELLADNIAVVDEGLAQLECELGVGLPEQVSTARDLPPNAAHQVQVEFSHWHEVVRHVDDVHELVLLDAEISLEPFLELRPGEPVSGERRQHEPYEFDDLVRSAAHGLVADLETLAQEVVLGQSAVYAEFVVLGREWIPPEHHLVQDDPQRPHVCRTAGLLALKVQEHLGGQVVESTEHALLVPRQPRNVGNLRAAEVTDFVIAACLVCV